VLANAGKVLANAGQTGNKVLANAGDELII